MNNTFKDLCVKYVRFTVYAIFIAAITVNMIRGEFVSAFYTTCIFVLTLLPKILRKWRQIYIPRDLDAAIGLFLFLTLFLGVSQNFYGKYPIWDSLLHFQSGFLLGIAGFVLFYILNGQTNKRLHLTAGFIALSAFNFSLAVSVLWEIYEYIADSRFGYDMQHGGLPDTMEDLMLNAASSFIIALLGYFWMLKTSRIPMTPKKIAEE